jgi:predicted short-subunit dehydrogenase-like oxidoreductase (DUF2520 family)
MLRGMAKQVSVTIVGPGSFGTALAKALHEAGIPVAEIVYRNGESARRAKKLAREAGAKAVEFEEWLGSRSGAPPERARAPVPTLSASVAWLCVGDSAIAQTAVAMASGGPWKGMTVFHSSGALASDELGPLRKEGAKVASVHPMMTFVRSAAASMKGVAFALEGDKAALAVAKWVVWKLGGESFEIKKKDKALYHALGAFVSPLIVAQMAAVERIGRELGFDGPKTRRIVGPILQQTIRNYIDHGPAAAFSGPIVRGDIATVKKHLAALKRVRGAEDIYRALAKMAVEELPSKNSVAIRKAIR